MESKTHRTTLMQLQLRLPARMIILVIENPALDAGFHERYAFDQKSSEP